MMKLLSLLTLISFVSPSFAALTIPDRQQLPAQNLLLNGGWENGKSGWTATTISLATDATNVFAGNNAGKMVFSSQTGNFSYSVTPGSGGVPKMQTASVNMEASCAIENASAIATMQLCGLSGGVEQNCQNVQASTAYGRVSANFVGPANGTSVGVEVKTTATATGTVYVDDCYVGPARNLGSGTFTTPWAVYTPTLTGFGTVTSLSSFYRRVGDSLEVTAFFTAGTVAASLASITLPLGYTIDSTKIPVANTSANDGQLIGHYINAAANQSGGLVTATGTSTALVYFAQGLASANPLKPVNGSSVATSATDLSYRFLVPIAQFTDQSFFRADATPASWSGYQTVAGGCSVTSATFVDFSACTSITLQTPITARNITCTTTGSSLPGIDCVLPRSGIYNVCATPTWFNGSGANNTLRLVSGATIINPNMGIATPSAGQNFSTQFCGDFNAASSGTTTFKIQGATSAGTLGIENGVATGSGAITWNITEKDAPMPAPYLQNQVSSNTSGQEHIERISFGGTGTGGLSNTTCAASPCTIFSQSGSWITSVTRSSAGHYVLNIAAGEFSAAPECTCTTSANQGLCFPQNYAARTSTSVSFIVDNTGLSSTIDDALDIQCMGPR